MNKHKVSERGQALIIIVFAVVALIGFTALAIDGGMVYSDRRHAQSASDAASLAGGGFAALALENYNISENSFDCDLPDLDPGNADPNSLVNKAIAVAMSRALSNDYVNAQVNVTVVCEDTGPPPKDKKYLDFTTTIVRETKTALIHFVYTGPAINQVEATVRVRPRTPIALGNAIVALNDSDCSGNQNGVILGGSSGTYVEGGGIFSNGCLKCNGSGNSHTVEVVPPDGIFFIGNMENCSVDELDPPAQPYPEIIPPEFYDQPEPDCSVMPNRTMPSGQDVILEPGVYTHISDGGKDTIILNPGLYCVTGSPNAIKISTAWFSGEGVTFYVTTGDVQITGGGDSEGNPSILSAPKPGYETNGAIGGTLIYLAHGNTGNVQITGNSESEFYGTIYVPDGDIVATGTGDVAAPLNTQLIAQNVEVAGNAYVDITFTHDDAEEIPAWIDLME
jgi:hypothetical protein